jgi:hypothetical protein
LFPDFRLGAPHQLLLSNWVFGATEQPKEACSTANAP